MGSPSLQHIGALNALTKRAGVADWIGYGLTAASFLPIPGVANAAAVGAGLWNTGRAALSGDMGGVALGLAETGVGALAGGYGGKATKLIGGALRGASKVKGLGTASRAAFGAGKAIQGSRAAQGAAKWIGANPGKALLATHLGAPLAYGGAKWALGAPSFGAEGGGGAGPVEGGGFLDSASKGPGAAQNIAPGVNFLPMASPSASGQEYAAA